MRHTIDEAASLVGRTRRSIYRAMNEGRLSYGLEANGRRYIDTSELIRAYGELRPMSQSVHAEMSHGDTVSATVAETGPGRHQGSRRRGDQEAGNAAVAVEVVEALVGALRGLSAEVEMLRAELAAQRLRLEHDGSKQQHPDQPPAKPARPRRAQSFADLIEDLGD